MVTETVLKDLVPAAVVTSAGQRWLRARAIITDQRIRVWVESRPAELVLDEPVVESVLPNRFHPSAVAACEVTTPSGLVTVTRALGACSCSLPNLMALRWPVL